MDLQPWPHSCRAGSTCPTCRACCHRWDWHSCRGAGLAARAGPLCRCAFTCGEGQGHRSPLLSAPPGDLLPSQSGPGTSVLSHLDSILTAGEEREQKGRGRGWGREEKPGPHNLHGPLLMVRWGWVGPEPGKAFGVTVRVKFQGCAFPLGGYFGKSTLLQPSADWLLRELEPGRLRALPGRPQRR